MARKSTLKEYKVNPFLDKLVVTTRTKSVEVKPIGKKSDVYINESTGEIAGTEVRTYRQVDDAEFVKIFTANIALTFDLNSAGIKAFNVLLFTVQQSGIERDVVALDELTLEDFLEFNKEKKLSKSTLERGIKELVKANIIAKHVRASHYFINPNFVFNGNRISFQTIIEKKK
ncbi:replication/maintenance protein RepL, partial [Vibrio splendidus]|uniref:replication/maintenance protein RepL n=1 Tax=Vibrio splendidus TaxID=29497 RepID=UPI003D0EC28F